VARLADALADHGFQESAGRDWDEASPLWRVARGPRRFYDSMDRSRHKSEESLRRS
jgi:hypothetical protein